MFTFFSNFIHRYRRLKAARLREEGYLKQVIASALNRAYQNGYDMSQFANETIAQDLISYDQTFEDYRPSDLLSGIAAWRASRLTPRTNVIPMVK